MSLGRSLLIMAGLAVAFVLGVLARPHVETLTTFRDVAPERAEPAATRADDRSAEARRVEATTMRARLEPVPVSPMSAELHEKLQPLLNRGTKMTIAAEGFRTGEQFAAVAHASRNLDIPFMVLKDRVVTQKKSLVSAIRELKPDANALREAEIARAAAKEDVSEIE